MSKIPEQEYRLCLGFLSFFYIDGKPANEVATEGEIEIFHAIIFRHYKRLEILCCTQYGKSLFVALACIILTCILKEVVCIVAPTTEKSRIIMRYYIQHLGDGKNFIATLEKNTKFERLMLEENKERIMLNNGGGIFVLSANATNSQKGVESAMGAGASNVILDEASLIPDDIEATIFRMIAGKGKDAFYCKIGNPFYRNHFLKTRLDSSYNQIFIDYHQALKEGRYTQSFIEEARLKPYFDILFSCQFPDEDSVDREGYIPLFSDKLVHEAMEKTVLPFGEKRLGVDIAEGGGDYNAFVLKQKNYMSVIKKYKSENTMHTASEIKMACNDYEVVDRNVFVDSIGIGKGVVDHLREQKWYVTPVKFSESAEAEFSSEEFYNLRAQCYWQLSQWLKAGGALSKDREWFNLLSIKYKIKNGKILIKPKDEIRKELGFSPDVLDAAALVFARSSSVIITKSYEDKRVEHELVKEFDFYKNRKTMQTTSYFKHRRQ
jgi:hypothetical protein